MVAVSFHEREGRLVVDGPCWASDAPGLGRAIRDAAGPAHGLVLDLTRVTSVPAEVAVAITKACTAAEADGGRVIVWTLPGSATASDLAAASCGRATEDQRGALDEFADVVAVRTT